MFNKFINSIKQSRKSKQKLPKIMIQAMQTNPTNAAKQKQKQINNCYDILAPSSDSLAIRRWISGLFHLDGFWTLLRG